MIRRAFAAFGATAILAVLAAPIPGGAQDGAGTAGPRLTLLDQPIAVAPDGDFTVLLEVDDAPTATEIAVDIFDAVQPNELVGPEPDEDPQATFPVLEVPPVAGDEPRPVGFRIQLYTDGQPLPDPAWGWKIEEPGVYPVRVRLWDADSNRLQVLMTSIIRLPEADQQVTQTDAALLVGVHRPPPEDPEARAATGAADAGLLEDLEPVLDVLADRPALPATFSITPEALARIGADDGAAQELAQLRAELVPDGRTVLDAPYVDIDAAGLVTAGLADNLTLQRDFGRQALAELLEPPVERTWQLDNRVDEEALAQLRTRGISRTLLPGDALASGAGVLAPVDLPSGGGTTRAVSVSDAYALGADPREDPVLAAHRLLGRLATTGAGPTGSPSVVVEVDPAVASEQTLQIVADALLLGTPFFTATDVPAVLDAPPAPAGAVMATPAAPELGTYPATYRLAQSDLDSYQSMVGGRPELISPYERTLAVSAARDLALEQRQRDAGSVTADLQVPFTSISVPEEDKVTLGADDAEFPLPVESSFDDPVKVVIELEANDRVAFPNDRIEETLEPGSTEVPIRVQTRAAGDTPVRITVRSPDGGVVLAESRYTIRSTAVSGVGIVLTAGAALFLAVWWGRHWRRSRREGAPGAEADTAPLEPGPV